MRPLTAVTALALASCRGGSPLAPPFTCGGDDSSVSVGGNVRYAYAQRPALGYCVTVVHPASAEVLRMADGADWLTGSLCPDSTC